MIVGVEPFSHFTGESGCFRCGAFTPTFVFFSGVARAPRDEETGVEPCLFTVPFKSGRHVSEKAGRVEHLIVKGEIVARNQVDAGGCLLLPVSFPKIPAYGFQRDAWNLTFPIKFGGFFQFTLLPDARIAE